MKKTGFHFLFLLIFLFSFCATSLFSIVPKSDLSPISRQNLEPEKKCHSQNRKSLIVFLVVDYESARVIFYREYNPAIGRWLTPDPAGYVDGMNLYRYYAGVNGVDVLGLGDATRLQLSQGLFDGLFNIEWGNRAKQGNANAILYRSEVGQALGGYKSILGGGMALHNWLRLKGGTGATETEKINITTLIRDVHSKALKDLCWTAAKAPVNGALSVLSFSSQAGLRKASGYMMLIMNMLDSTNPEAEALKYLMGNLQGKVLDKFFGADFSVFKKSVDKILGGPVDNMTDSVLNKIEKKLKKKNVSERLTKAVKKLFESVKIHRIPQWQKYSKLHPQRWWNKKKYFDAKRGAVIIYNKKTDVVISVVGQSTGPNSEYYRQLVLMYGVKGKGSNPGFYDDSSPFGKLKVWFDVSLWRK